MSAKNSYGIFYPKGGATANPKRLRETTYERVGTILANKAMDVLSLANDKNPDFKKFNIRNLGPNDIIKNERTNMFFIVERGGLASIDEKWVRIHEKD